MSVRRWVRWIGLSVFILTVSGFTLAQGGLLAYGQTAQGTLSAQAPQGFYSFSGTEGDVVTIYAIGISSGLQPTLILLGATGQLAFADDDPYTPITGDASINYRLTQTATYNILLGSLNGNVGDYFIKLEGSPSGTNTVVPQGQTLQAPAGATQVLVVDLNPAAPTTFAFTPDPPDLQFTAQVVDNNGQLVGVFGSALLASGLTFPPGEGQYTVTLIFAEPSTPGTVQVASGTGTEQPVSQPPSVPTVTVPTAAAPEPLITEEAEPVTGPPDGVCSVVTSGAVNVRSGPGTNYGIIGSLQTGVYYTVIGVHNDWYVINYNSQTGWVANFVVEAFGPCAGLPFVESPSGDQAPSSTAPSQPTATTSSEQPVAPTATVSSEQPIAPTATYTPTTQAVQATPTYTPSYTPTTQPAPQVAPEDARFNNPLDIPLDNTASVLDFVSYPGGDTEDRIRYSVTGMNNNVALSGGKARLVISASCFGEGTDNVQFFTGGQTYSCGQTLVDKSVTADSDTGSITITAVGGNATYVQWVLTGTATRE